MKRGIACCLAVLAIGLTIPNTTLAKERYRIGLKVQGTCDKWFNNYKYGPTRVADVPSGQECQVKIRTRKITVKRKNGRKIRRVSRVPNAIVTLGKRLSWATDSVELSSAVTNARGEVTMSFPWEANTCDWTVDAADDRFYRKIVDNRSENDDCYKLV